MTIPTEIYASDRRTIEALKARAFCANRRAKRTHGPARAAHYRVKHSVINTFLKADLAWVIEADYRQSDALFGVQFAGGGKLHINLSRLDSEALVIVRAQILAQRASDGSAYFQFAA